MNWGPSDLKTSVLTTELLSHYIEFGKNIFERTFQCKNEEISVFSAGCQLISQIMMVLNLVLHEAQMTFTKFQWSINFCIFFSHILAGCQLIEKINVDS